MPIYTEYNVYSVHHLKPFHTEQRSHLASGCSGEEFSSDGNTRVDTLIHTPFFFWDWSSRWRRVNTSASVWVLDGQTGERVWKRDRGEDMTRWQPRRWHADSKCSLFSAEFVTDREANSFNQVHLLKYCTELFSYFHVLLLYSSTLQHINYWVIFYYYGYFRRLHPASERKMCIFTIHLISSAINQK